MSLILLAGLAGYALSNPRKRKHRRRRNPISLTAPQRAFLTYLAEAGSPVLYDDLRDKNKLLRFWPAYKSAKKRGYIVNDVDGPVLLTDAGRAALGKTNPRRRRNPISINALAMPAANLLWRKHGYQSPGHAEDLAMMARRGTTAAKLWARVAQITKGWLYGGKKRSNPAGGPRMWIPTTDPKKARRFKSQHWADFGVANCRIHIPGAGNATSKLATAADGFPTTPKPFYVVQISDGVWLER